ncbi:hypothetical protein C8R46DRAFT_1035767 [Mycena filopes]|nr:hypothetical protein C8R46DRAFT_1035767 [Mycena filopes]
MTQRVEGDKEPPQGAPESGGNFGRGALLMTWLHADVRPTSSPAPIRARRRGTRWRQLECEGRFSNEQARAVTKRAQSRLLLASTSGAMVQVRREILHGSQCSLERSGDPVLNRVIERRVASMAPVMSTWSSQIGGSSQAPEMRKVAQQPTVTGRSRDNHQDRGRSRHRGINVAR